MPFLNSLTLRELESIDFSSTTAILFIANNDPIGVDTPLNLFESINGAIAQRLAQSDNYLVLPPINLGYSTPFKSFKGVISLKSSTLEKIIADTLISVTSFGVNRVLVIDSSNYAKGVVDKAVKAYKRGLPSDFNYGYISWQSDSSLKRAIYSNVTIKDFWRSELVALLLYSELTGFKVSERVDENLNISEKQFNRWKKTMDPERLKSYFPRANLSSWEALPQTDGLFEILIESIDETIKKGYIFHGI